MPRPKPKCLLCHPKLDRETHDIVWRGLSQGGKKGALTAALSRNININEQEIRRHFEYHRPRQARPVDWLNQDQSLKLAEKLIPRKQAIIELAFRLGVVDEELLVNLFYLNNDLLAARKAASRDLRQLLNKDFLFRIYPENMPGKSVWIESEDSEPPAFFLGVNGRALASKTTGFVIKENDFCLVPEDRGSWAGVVKNIGSNFLINQFAKEIKNYLSPGVKEDKVGSLTAGFSFESFATGDLIKIKIKDPNRKTAVLSVSGVGALYFLDLNMKPLLFPFFYHLDDGRRKPEKIINDLISTQAIVKAGQVNELLPQLQPYQAVPVIVIAKDKERLDSIISFAKKRRPESLPDAIVLGSFKEDFSQPLLKDDWIDIFSNQIIRKNLWQVAIEAYRKNPVSDKVLKISGPRSKQK